MTYKLVYRAALLSMMWLLFMASGLGLQAQDGRDNQADLDSASKSLSNAADGSKNNITEVEAPTEDDLDFGDAPDPFYPTLLASDGARHTIMIGYHLGVSVDPEPNGQPNATSVGDDTDGSDDEDGVSFVSDLKQGSNARVDVLATATGILNAWIDFNGDGDWDDDGEHIFVDTSIPAGLSTLSFAVPSVRNEDIIAVARFRFSSVQGLSYNGLAPDGEVEDYLVDVLIPVEMISCKATFVPDGVKIEWITGSETDNLGFHVHRAETEDGEFVQITNEIIPGAGNSETTQYYEYLDKTAKQGESYYYKLSDHNYDGSVRFHFVVKPEYVVPTEYILQQNYPNPFNPETTIKYSIAQDGYVTLKIYNMLGQLVRILVDESKLAGEYAVEWNGTDDFGNLLPSGVYIYSLACNDFKDVRRMTFTK